MNLRKARKGSLSTGTLNTAILAIVLVTVLFLLYSELVPDSYKLNLIEGKKLRTQEMT